MTAAALWLYAVTRDTCYPPPDTTGVDGAPVFAVPLPLSDGATADSASTGPLLVWVSSAPDDRTPGMERAREHDRVVAVAHGSGVTPLPVRFGHCFPSEAELRSVMGPRSVALRHALEGVSGREEWRIAAVPLPVGAGVAGTALPRDVSGAPGRRRLLAAQERLHARSELLAAIAALDESIRSATGGMILNSSAIVGTGARDCTLAYLAPRSAAAELRSHLSAQIGKLGSDHLSQPLLLGPMAPWSFATMES